MQLVQCPSCMVYVVATHSHVIIIGALMRQLVMMIDQLHISFAHKHVLYTDPSSHTPPFIICDIVHVYDTTHLFS